MSWNKLKLDNADSGTQGPGGICWTPIPRSQLAPSVQKLAGMYDSLPFILVIKRITISGSLEPPVTI